MECPKDRASRGGAHPQCDLLTGFQILEPTGFDGQRLVLPVRVHFARPVASLSLKLAYDQPLFQFDLFPSQSQEFTVKEQQHAELQWVLHIKEPLQAGRLASENRVKLFLPPERKKLKAYSFVLHPRYLLHAFSSAPRGPTGAGPTVAVVGMTGAGKSTFANALETMRQNRVVFEQLLCESGKSLEPVSTRTTVVQVGPLGEDSGFLLADLPGATKPSELEGVVRKAVDVGVTPSEEFEPKRVDAVLLFLPFPLVERYAQWQGSLDRGSLDRRSDAMRVKETEVYKVANFLRDNDRPYVVVLSHPENSKSVKHRAAVENRSLVVTKEAEEENLRCVFPGAHKIRVVNLSDTETTREGTDGVLASHTLCSVVFDLLWAVREAFFTHHAAKKSRSDSLAFFTKRKRDQEEEGGPSRPPPAVSH